MVAAAFWSLLSPSIDMSASLGMNPWLTALIGFMGGGVLLFLGDRLFTPVQQDSGPLLRQEDRRQKGGLRRAVPCWSFPSPSITFPRAWPSGRLWVSGLWAGWLHSGRGLDAGPGHWPAESAGGHGGERPLRREGYSRGQSFFYGQLSGVVEPIAAVLGALLVLKVRTCLPFLLAFAAGAMIYVVVEELIPESQTNENKDWMALFTLVGFSVMMVMDVALG
ncbi:MAG: ZIP family metal transporter [Evtepia gabavorous]